MHPSPSPAPGHLPAAAAALLFTASLGAQSDWSERQRLHLPRDLSTAGALADLDGDGDLDYVFAMNVHPPLRLFVNDGAARFQPHPTAPTAGMHGPEIESGDIDGDGDIDLVLDGGVLLRIAGVFAHISLGFGTVLECADVTGDGLADVISTTSVWRSLGGGVFTSLGTLPLPLMWQDTELADFDGDGDLDLLLGVSPQNGPAVPGFEQAWRNNGAGTFTNVTNQWLPGLVDDDTGVVVAADFDGDGDVDCAFGGDPGTWKLRRNDGTGVLQPWVTLNTAVSELADAAADLDGDGDQDLPGMSSWLRNDGGGVFTRVEFAPLDGARLHGVGDLDGDGRPDLIGRTTRGLPRLWLNQLPQGFVDAARSGGIPAPGPALGPAQPLAVGDCDGDGDPDFVRGAGPLHRNDGSGWTEPQPTGWAPTFVAALLADVDGDQDLDAVGHEPGLLRVQHNQGGTWSAGAGLVVTGEVLAAFDADGDGDRDLLLPAMRLLRNDGTGTFSLDPATPAGSLPCTCAAAADFDGDGDLDVLAGDTRLHMFVNDGTGAFTWTPSRLGIIPAQVQMAEILPFDTDGDGDIDAFVAQEETSGTVLNTGPLLMLRNVGGGALIDATSLLPPTTSAAGLADAGDLDGDGDIDLVLSTAGGFRQWHNSGTGLMLDAGAIGNAFFLERPVLTDVDGDGDLDVAVKDRMFDNRRWHAAAPFLPQIGRDYVVEFGSTAMQSGVAVPFLGARARWPLPPFGTVGIDVATAVPLPLVTLAAGTGTLRIPVPLSPALRGQSFGVQAVLLDGQRYHLTPVVYDTVH